MTQSGNVLYTDIFKLLTPKLIFLEMTCSAWVPGEKAWAELSGSVPATGIWGLVNPKVLLFEGCWYFSGFRKKEGRGGECAVEKKLKSQPTKGTAGPIQVKKLFCHIQEIPTEETQEEELRADDPQPFLFKMTRPTEGHSRQMCKLVFSVTPTPNTHCAKPHPKPQVFPLSGEWWVLTALSHPPDLERAVVQVGTYGWPSRHACC